MGYYDCLPSCLAALNRGGKAVVDVVCGKVVFRLVDYKRCRIAIESEYQIK